MVELSAQCALDWPNGASRRVHSARRSPRLSLLMAALRCPLCGQTIFEPSVSNDSLSLRFSASLADEDCHRSAELASSPPAQFNVASPISSGSVAWSLSPRASHVLASGSANLDAEVVALDPADDAIGRPPILPPLRRSPPPNCVSVGDGRGRCAPRRSVRELDRALSRAPSGCGRY